MRTTDCPGGAFVSPPTPSLGPPTARKTSASAARLRRFAGTRAASSLTLAHEVNPASCTAPIAVGRRSALQRRADNETAGDDLGGVDFMTA